ncbi:hypothetical protein WI697_18875 [Tistrella mobilis]|uniref:hypothetical protein n=1 Tax=Tistrella mobilis TaxID=171437 RepID=UPI0031F6FEBE
MNHPDHPAFVALRRRFLAPDTPADAEELLALSTFDDNCQTDQDPRMVLNYLRDLGVSATTLQKLHDGINNLPDEEELAAHWCREGVAVSHASDGSWFLFLEARQ